MKKRILLFLSALLISTLVFPAMGVAAEKTMAFEADSVSVSKAAASVEVPIRVTKNDGYSTGRFDVSWNNSVLELAGVEYNESLTKDDGSVPFPITNKGIYKISFGDPVAESEFTGTGVFFTLNFKIISGAAEGTYDISLSEFDVCDFDVNDIAVTGKNGAVTLTGSGLTLIPGDINSDGTVNNKDITRLMRYVKYKDVEVNKTVTDVNGDGTVNNKDITRLMRYVKYKDVEIHPLVS